LNPAYEVSQIVFTCESTVIFTASQPVLSEKRISNSLRGICDLNIDCVEWKGKRGGFPSRKSPPVDNCP